jgi:hypothetical protein
MLALACSASAAGAGEPTEASPLPLAARPLIDGKMSADAGRIPRTLIESVERADVGPVVLSDPAAAAVV